jgi:hypothetical protein
MCLREAGQCGFGGWGVTLHFVANRVSGIVENHYIHVKLN